MTDFLDEKRKEILARMNELQPLVDEHGRLTAAAAALEGVPASRNGGSAPTPRAAATRRRSRSRATAKSANGNSRGRPKGTGTRAAEALAIVRAQPGVTIPKIAEEMGIKQNYLYRVLPGLAADNLVKKNGQGWHPVATA
jgi:hypothetical protein